MNKITIARSVIFFLNIFLALMIVTGASFLLRSSIGKISIVFGFSMLLFTVVLRILKQW